MKRDLAYRTLCVVLLVMGVALAAWAQSPALPEEAEALQAKVDALTSYKARFSLEVKEEGEEPIELEGKLFYQRPNLRRLEIRYAGEVENSQLLVDDGKVEWQHGIEDNTIYKITNPPLPPGPHQPFADLQLDTLRFIERIEAEGQTLLRFEADPLDAVNETAPVKIKTVRVDVAEGDGLTRRTALLTSEDKEILIHRFYDIEVNAPIPPESFVFTVPDGVIVEELTFRE